MTTQNLRALLDPVSLPSHINVKPEEQLTIEIANKLRDLIGSNKLKGLFLHIPNEGKRHYFTGQVMKAMGLISGAPDILVFTRDRVIAFEVKTKTGRLSDNQKSFRLICKELDIPYHVVRSVQSVIDTLRLYEMVE